jgi:hypothetical protein
VVATKNQGPRVNHKIPSINEALPELLRACYEMDTDLFMGYDGEPTKDRIFREQDAKNVCSGCSLMVACREWAMTHDERGVWGGTNDDDRRAIRTGRKPRSGRAQDPDGLTKQERRRVSRIKIAKNLKARGIGLDDIAREIGVTLGTLNEYLRFERKSDHGETDSDQDQQAQATPEGSGSQDSRGKEAALLKEGGS